jgi:hypothetical protein
MWVFGEHGWVALLVIALAAAWWWHGRAGYASAGGADIIDGGVVFHNIEPRHATDYSLPSPVPHILAGAGDCDGRYQWDSARKMFVRDDGQRAVHYNYSTETLTCRAGGKITATFPNAGGMWQPA